MNSRIVITLILFGSILFLSGLRANAQDQDFGTLTAEAKMAHQKGDHIEAVRLYKQALATNRNA